MNDTSHRMLIRLKIWRKIEEKWMVVAESPVVVPVIGLNEFTIDPPLRIDGVDRIDPLSSNTSEPAPILVLPV